MESLDLQVLSDVLAWRRAGHEVTLVTVAQTWGSAPRRPGALMALRDDGHVSGSVSGGCVEDDLVARTRAGERGAGRAGTPAMIVYGVSRDEAARFGIPCGGTLRLVQEPVLQTDWIDQVLAAARSRQPTARHLHLPTGRVQVHPAQRGDGFAFDGITMVQPFGPRWRLLLIGAGQLGQAVAAIATMLDFEVLVCDPRQEQGTSIMSVPGVRRLPGMPDDAVLDAGIDAHTAVVTLTHDPKLDDMALIEALRSPAFFVGALGSRRSTAARRQRLKEHFDLTDAELDRLQGPVGLAIGAETPGEIAVSIVAGIVAARRGTRALPPGARPVLRAGTS